MCIAQTVVAAVAALAGAVNYDAAAWVADCSAAEAADAVEAVETVAEADPLKD